MLSRARNHLSYANVVSTLCLFVLLGGSAYAATKITGKNVKDGSLTGADVKNNSLTGADVKNLAAGDFKGGAVPTGPRGPQGPTGPKGLTGPQGPGANRFFVDTFVNLKDGVVFNNKDFDVTVSCFNLVIKIDRHAPANVAVNGSEVYGAKDSGSPKTVLISNFLDGSTGGTQNHDGVFIATAGQGEGIGTVTVQSYSPGSDTRHEYTVVGTIVDEGGGKCAANGSVIPAS